MTTRPVPRARLFTVVAVLATLVASVLVTDGADAAFPGENGEIAFSRSGEIYVMNPDGSGQTNITNNTADDGGPSWSPGGTRILFTSNRDNFNNPEIFVMNADGSNQFQLTTTTAVNHANPSYSPDGTQIVYERLTSADGREIYVMNADGTDQTRLTFDPPGYFGSSSPAWSPDGSKIAFISERDMSGGTEIYVMNPDGTDQTRITNNTFSDSAPDWSPDGTRLVFQGAGITVMNADGSNPVVIAASGSIPRWSPDGTKIVFLRRVPSSGPFDLFVMDADGSNQVNITNSTDFEGGASWQPLPDGPPPTTTSTTAPSTTTTTRPPIDDVTSVTGEAFGYLAIVSLLGGPPATRPCDPPPAPPETNCGPSPVVSLPPTGGIATETDPTGLARIGPAIFVESGPVTASSSGTIGPNGSVTSSATMQGLTDASPWSADQISSTCTASGDELSGSTNILGGELVISYDTETQEPTETVTLPENPAPNTEYLGSIDYVNDDFRAVFNEQVIEDGVLTVYAAHFYLLGVNAIGDVWIGKSTCGVTGDGTPPTTTTSTTAPPTTTTSSTPPTSTTLPPPTTTSTSQPPTTTTSTSQPPTTTTSTSTTLPPTTTTSSTLPPTSTTTTAPPDDDLVVTVDDTVITNGNRGQVTGSITCDAGLFFALELDLTQGDANAAGTARGSCTGSPQSYTVGFATAGSSFNDGPAQACVAARTGQPGSRAIIDSTEVCEDVTVDVRSRP